MQTDGDVDVNFNGKNFPRASNKINALMTCNRTANTLITSQLHFLAVIGGNLRSFSLQYIKMKTFSNTYQNID